MLKEYPALKVEISGHTSDEGKRERNMKLSQERAESAKRTWCAAGIDGGRITTVGYGPDKPLVSGKGKVQEKNRRIEFRLLGQDDAPAGAPSLPATPPGAPAAPPPADPKAGDAPAKSPPPESPKP